MKKIIVTALLLALSAPAIGQTIYRWVDREGVVHFGAQPPKGVEATLVSTAGASGGLGVSAEDIRGQADPSATAGSKPEVSYAEQRRRERMQRQEEVRKLQAERQGKCAEMERQRAALEPSPRVIINDEDGNPVRMDDNDRLERLEEAKKYLAENCR